MKYLFGTDLSKWHYDDAYLYYVTPVQIRQIMTRLTAEHYGRPSCIWDMFCGIGCDTISMQTHLGSKLISTELNSETFGHLLENIKEFGASESITPINCDCSRFVPTPLQVPDLVYFDPPWGSDFESGKEFDFGKVHLSNGKNVIELLREILDKYKNVVVKAPYDCVTFELEFDKHITKIMAFPKPKLKFLFLRKNDN